jgi:hypothetical protein
MNPLDKIPQFRVDWANHLLWCWLVFTALVVVGMPTESATLLCLLVSVYKKLVDYIEYHESAGICIAKGLLTPLIPYSVLALQYLKMVVL